MFRLKVVAVSEIIPTSGCSCVFRTRRILSRPSVGKLAPWTPDYVPPRSRALEGSILYDKLSLLGALCLRSEADISAIILVLFRRMIKLFHTTSFGFLLVDKEAMLIPFRWLL